MSAPTTSVRFLLARAAVRSSGLLHIVSARDTGALNPVCAANPIRSTNVETRAHLEAGVALCSACSGIAASLAGTVEAGVAVFLDSTPRHGGLQLLDVPLDQIRTDGVRPADAGLIHSVAAQGVLQPVIVRRTAGGLVLVAGGRRLAAAALAGQATIPALVRDLDDEAAVVATLVENLHRVNLDPIAQAEAYYAALEQLDCSTQALADRVGVSRALVSNTVRLRWLPAEIRDHLAAGRLTMAHGLALLRVEDPAEQVALARRAVEEGMTTRGVSAAARRAPAAPLGDLAAVLAGLLGATVRATSKGVSIEVDEADVPRLLEQLEAVAA